MGRLQATNVSEGIGASVRRRRVEAGIRQDLLAERVGISPSHLSRFERGKRHVSLATLDAIVRALLELGVEPLPELTRPSAPGSPYSSRRSPGHGSREDLE
jgi:transcriptional regulator with XRE-family HTH domain